MKTRQKSGYFYFKFSSAGAQQQSSTDFFELKQSEVHPKPLTFFTDGSQLLKDNVSKCETIQPLGIVSIPYYIDTVHGRFFLFASIIVRRCVICPASVEVQSFQFTQLLYIQATGYRHFTLTSLQQRCCFYHYFVYRAIFYTNIVLMLLIFL